MDYAAKSSCTKDKLLLAWDQKDAFECVLQYGLMENKKFKSYFPQTVCVPNIDDRTLRFTKVMSNAPFSRTRLCRLLKRPRCCGFLVFGWILCFVIFCILTYNTPAIGTYLRCYICAHRMLLCYTLRAICYIPAAIYTNAILPQLKRYYT